jgi:hypothetical protein
MKTVSIHQPNYLPWLGFFDKIAKSDTFVVFDNVQFPRGKQHFGHRNLIKSPNGEGKWLTVPLVGKSDMKNFNEIGINYNGWNADHLNLIKSYYSKAPHFKAYFPELESKLLLSQYNYLSQMNVELIKMILGWLEINTEIVLCSELCKEEVSGGDRIMFLLKKLGATHYVSGTGEGSMKYINEQEFKENQIELRWQHYSHPRYVQLFGEFKENMSVLDLIFNRGKDSREILVN